MRRWVHPNPANIFRSVESPQELSLDGPGRMSRLQICNICYERLGPYLLLHLSFLKLLGSLGCTRPCNDHSELFCFANAALMTVLLAVSVTSRKSCVVVEIEKTGSRRDCCGGRAEANPEDLPKGLDLDELVQEIVPAIPGTSDEGNPEIQSAIFDTLQVIASRPCVLGDFITCVRKSHCIFGLFRVRELHGLMRNGFIMCAGIF